MAEDSGGEQIEAEAPLETSAAAVALALDGARDRPELAGPIADFLREQRALIAEQRHHLREQFARLKIGIFNERLTVTLKLMTALVGVVVAAGLGFMAWNAAGSNGLLIEPFSVPPDLAARGLTGEVVAAKLLDRLSAMQAQTSSQRAPQSYANSWTLQDIKMDIPEAGVSLTELDRFLREKLGHDTHVTGEVVRTATGLSLTARAGLNGADSVAGSDAELDALVQRLSESIYRLTQPYRYGIYLASHNRLDEAVPIFVELGRYGPDEDRPWAYTALANVVGDRDGIEAAIAAHKRALALQPGFGAAALNVARMENDKSLPEQTARDDDEIVSQLTTSRQRTIRADIIPVLREERHAERIQQFGEFREAAQEYAHAIQHSIPGRFGLSAELARAYAGAHDLAAARLALDEPVQDSGLALGLSALYKIWAKTQIDSDLQDWRGVMADAGAIASLIPKYPGLPSFAATTVDPVIATAEARLGRMAVAEARIAPTPANCYVCLITRARIAELRGQHGRADWWFARAVEDAPSIPFAYGEWGAALLARGDTDGAIAKFTIASQKGPHFADPLELWGEALMAQHHPDAALAKFVEAEKYAPNWGRLHLKWGEALAGAGSRDEAKQQFAIAATLELAPADKFELARASARRD